MIAGREPPPQIKITLGDNMKILKPRTFPVKNFHGILTSSQTMIGALEKIKKAAMTQESVLIRGETGTGKELVARLIYRCSPRADQAFFALNCAAFNKELMTSELFGHKKGAFTGADHDTPGILKSVNKGTLFLDEIAELDLDLQAKILRVIQDKVYTPVGSTKVVEANVRFISATHASLRELVQKKLFREDLMYRIRVIPVYLPSLREREDDVEMLIWRFVEEMNSVGSRTIIGIETEAFECMLAYRWPGNIRELRNNIVYAYHMGDGDIITSADLLPELQVCSVDHLHSQDGAGDADFEDLAILDLLKKHQGKKSAVAEELGISRATLWRKLKNMGV